MLWGKIMEFKDLTLDDIEKVLLVEPDFPIPNKSRNHSNFLPIGLLKIATYFREKSIDVELIRFKEDKNRDYNQTTLDFNNKSDASTLIFITSIFTYWSEHVKKAVMHYKIEYPNAKIIVGGIYASLMEEHCLEYTQCDEIITGPIPEVEECLPAYDLVNVDYQIIHTSRGCIRHCGFCGTYKIEPKWICKKSIKDEILGNNKKKVIFYDNNLLANDNIEYILNELIELKKDKKITYVESQSGFDGRILRKKPYLAKMLKDAGFKNPKIAWDYGIKQAPKIKEQIDLLLDAGFTAKEISIFMIYNFEPPYEEMEEKRVKCAEWGVQITDCRYRPLNATFDNYSSYKRNQTDEDYYIHEEMGWSDPKIRKFRRNIRRHNICMRHEVDYHSTILERKQIPQERARELRGKSFKEIKEKYSEELPDVWSPLDFHPWDEQDYFKSKAKKRKSKTKKRKNKK